MKINENSHGTYRIDSSVKFKTLMLRSSLGDYIDTYILVNGTTTVPKAGTLSLK